MSITPLKPAPEAPSRRERQRLETRNRIYEAALEEFRRVGFAQTQIDPIVERAGVARGTFYFHFPTKEHVLYETQRRFEASIVARFRELSLSVSIKEFLLGVIDAMVAEGRSVGDRALGREIIAMYAREPRVVDPSALPLVVAIVDFFSEAAERGEIRDDLSPEEVARIFLSNLFGFIVAAVDYEESLSEFGRVIDVFVRGISP